jgi:proteasome lid subunit RPN8/RPN11
MDIEFGKLQEVKPQVDLRPDEDGQLAVATIGQPVSTDLPIYVDLDVMRDMEAHARSNTRVELGGVMLGFQRVDSQGFPFVIVSDCLRAEHYEATKGSFKFTHETWSQITRDRAKFRPDLEMVGWYHTHPGWSVFLSGMDLFICDHFFNRPLDVALVIDPCKGDRGWFYWNVNNSSDQTDTLQTDEAETVAASPLRTGGFFLTTSRFRQEELTYFSNLYNRDPLMNHDPRYGGHPAANSMMGTGQTMVQLIDQRKPIVEITLAGMLLLQLLFVSFIAWRMVAPGFADANAGASASAQLDRLDELENRERQRIAQAAQQDILQLLVSTQNGRPDFVEKYTELKTVSDEIKSNLSAQISMTNNLQAELRKTTEELTLKSQRVDTLSDQLQATQKELADARQQIASLNSANRNASAKKGEQPEDSISSKFEMPWWLAFLMACGILGIGGGTGFVLARSDYLRTQFEPTADGKKEKEPG